MSDEFGIGIFPECHNSKCQWHMGTNHRDGYKYLDNTCYSGSSCAKGCEDRILKKDKEK